MPEDKRVSQIRSTTAATQKSKKPGKRKQQKESRVEFRTNRGHANLRSQNGVPVAWKNSLETYNQQ